MLKDVKVINCSNFKDKRGFLWTVWEKNLFKNIFFNHDKVSISKKNALRGLHCDFKSWKLVTCLYGKFFFVIVNLKKNSKDYLKSKSWILDYKKPKLILVPPNYANGHLSLSSKCIFFYKWSYKGRYPDVELQKSYKWDDPKFKIKWPINNPILSKRDQNSKFI